MPKLNDYTCNKCGTRFEYMCENAEDAPTCPSCDAHEVEVCIGASKLLTHIIPTYPGCKRMKAGYVHSHGDRPAEKVSVSVPATISSGGKS